VRSIFLKIFLSFWLAQALFVVFAILVTLAMRPAREISQAEANQATYLAGALQAFQTGGAAKARDYLHDIRDREHVRLYMFDDQYRDLTGRRPPEWIDKVARGQTRTADTLLGRIRPMQFLRTTLTASDGHTYVLVTELPPEAHELFGPHGVPGLGIAIAVLCSGLVCYFLARYMTSPVVRLRQATQRLASGDLTARAGAGSSRRGDEMAELVRDFDAMAERLESLVNAQSRLLKDISHELRSPLARLNVALGLARQRAGEGAQSALERIDLEAERLNELIGRLLTIARLESGTETVQKVPVELGELIAIIAEDAEFEAQNRDCHVVSQIESDCVVMGEPALLHSAIENVVRNATRYTRPASDVVVRLSCGPGAGQRHAIIEVTDNGPGVPEEALQKLFRPFYRIDDARVRQTGGVGLGLAITERAVRLHGGSVVASNRPEGGLKIEIRLPIVTQTPPEEILPEVPVIAGQE
jgi:two-component system sensor histidine kinase CpxA